MKICIVGWYGTETIGDRAILLGIMNSIYNVYPKAEIFLGSLYPFYSERMISEDYDLYEKLISKNVKIKLFNSKKVKVLDEYLKKSDIVMMGGGPIMHIGPLYMIDYAFKKAKKLGKKTIIMGCGIGPLFGEEYQKLTRKISKNSDAIILRDNISKQNLLKINAKIKESDIKVNYDPAVSCALSYKDKFPRKINNELITLNLRRFPGEYSQSNIGKKVNDILIKFTEKLCDENKDKEIKLIPMHYFHIGNDDREFQNELKFKTNCSNLSVQNKILTLEEVMRCFGDSTMNIGMRFHSVVLQTILGGNNYILDYTEPKKGKIKGFIEDIDDKSYYNNKYVNLQEISDESDIRLDFVINNKNKFQFDKNRISEKLNEYEIELKKLSQNE